MRTIFLLLFAALLLNTDIYSQDGLLNKLKEKVEDKILDEIDKEEEEPKKNKAEKEEEELSNQVDEETKVQEKPVVKNEQATLKAYSKFDFVPGDQVLYFDDFSQDAVGDYPAKWNTNGTGETVTLNNFKGNWFNLKMGAVHMPDYVKTLPENFTIEFDAIYAMQPDRVNPAGINITLWEALEGERIDGLVPGKGGVQLGFEPYRVRIFNWKDQGYASIDNYLDNDYVMNHLNQIMKVSIWVQKQRVRMYLDNVKVIDIPRAVEKDIKLNSLRFMQWDEEQENFEFYLSNFRIAGSTPDMRNKLITEGKLVTTGILFDTGSDKIKPESYGVLKEIAKVLTDNSEVKIKIIGHTDSDGNDATNLELSKKRSASVKNSLATEFKIDASRMSTDGKGETEPVMDNKTSEGKANNRRVEFIKM